MRGAILFTESESYDLAIDDFKKAIELDPLDSRYYYNLCLVYYDLGLLNPGFLIDALRYINKALSFKTKDKEAKAVHLSRRAIIYAAMGNKIAAFDDIVEAAELDYVHSRLFKELKLNEVAAEVEKARKKTN